MEASGWNIMFTQIMETKNLGKVCSPNGDSWYSYNGGARVGSMSYTFSRTGTFNLTFANCYGDGYVPVSYDGVEIGRSTSLNDTQTIEGAYENGTVLELKDMGANSVVQITEFITTDCLGNCFFVVKCQKEKQCLFLSSIFCSFQKLLFFLFCYKQKYIKILFRSTINYHIKKIPTLYKESFYI